MPKTKSKKPGAMILVVVLIIVCAVLGVAVLGKKSPHKSKADIPEGPATMLSMGEMVVNLADTSETRYLKTDIVLEIHGTMPAAEGGGEGGGGGSANAPLRDAIIGVLSSKQFAELNKPGGKDQLKEELMAAVNKRLEEAKVTEVYFNEFAMQ